MNITCEQFKYLTKLYQFSYLCNNYNIYCDDYCKSSTANNCFCYCDTQTVFCVNRYYYYYKYLIIIMFAFIFCCFCCFCYNYKQNKNICDKNEKKYIKI